METEQPQEFPDPEVVEGDVPGIVPEDHSNDPQERTYRVSGTASVQGHAPGEVFTATLAPDLERLYLEYGHLEEVTEPVQPPTEASEATPSVEEAQTEPVTEPEEPNV